MATITSAGIGSGLDIESIITQLVALERQPIDRLDRKTSIINAQISAYGSLKSKIADFQSAMEALSSTSSFQVFQALSADEDVFAATADSSAAAGSYAIDVTALAERHKIASTGFTDSATTVGEGTLTLSVGSNSFNVVIDSTNSSVTGIRDAINSASDNTGVTATIVTDDTGAHLVLSSDDTGTANALTVTVSGDTDGNDTDTGGLSALVYDAGVTENLSQVTAAADAVVQIDGSFTVTSSSNDITGAIEGVTINAKSIGSSTLTISRDDETITENVEKFAEAYNALRTEIDKQRAGQLEADSTLLTIENQISNVLNSGSAITGSTYSYLIEAGVTIDKEGVMSVDSDKLTTALNSDFDSFVNLFAATDEGFASRFEALADGWLDTDGLIDAREDGLNTQLDQMADDKVRMEARMDIVEARIRSQFTAMDTLVASLNSTGNFLIQQLSTLNNSNS